MNLSQLYGKMIMIQVSAILVFLVVVNIVSFIFFGVDKLKSVSGGWRISESRLLLIAFFGPFGAFVGMLLFRHKTRKAKFLVVPIFLLIQLWLILYFHLM